LGKLGAARERILLIDNDSIFLNEVNQRLQSVGFEVITAENGNTGLKKLYSGRPDLVLLGLTLPDMDGWEVCRRIREMTDIPVIISTSAGQKSDVLKGFSLGADDFVNKQPDFPELIARIGAILRRSTSSRNDAKPDVLYHMDIEIRLRSHQVFVRGNLVKLSPIEYKLLTCLLENRGWLMTHEELLRKVWGPDYINDRNFVKLYIRYLRQKIERDPAQPQLILTERGIGYRFATEVKEPVG
jgi:two-component system, OmpR family, KDP operon response regulator KdpE